MSLSVTSAMKQVNKKTPEKREAALYQNRHLLCMAFCSSGSITCLQGSQANYRFAPVQRPALPNTHPGEYSTGASKLFVLR